MQMIQNNMILMQKRRTLMQIMDEYNLQVILNPKFLSRKYDSMEKIVERFNLKFLMQMETLNITCERKMIDGWKVRTILVEKLLRMRNSHV